MRKNTARERFALSFSNVSFYQKYCDVKVNEVRKGLRLSVKLKNLIGFVLLC